MVLATLLAAALLSEPVGDVREILRRSVANQERMLKLGDNYNYTERMVHRHLDGKGRVTKTEVTTYDVIRIDGMPVRRLVAKDDRPLTPEEAKKAERDLDRATKRLLSEAPKDREERRRRMEKFRREREEITREVLEAFDFRLAGREAVDGIPCHVIQATPRRAYQPRKREVEILKHLSGRLWISEDGGYLAKFEAEVTDPISFGWILGKLNTGSRITFEQRFVNGEAWLPARAHFRGDGRIIVRRLRLDTESTYSNYKRFSVDTRVVPLGVP